MEIFQTNAALGYRQLAFILRLDKSEHGYNYLCIGTQNTSDDDNYRVGEIVEDLEDFYLEDTSFDISDSPLNGTFLFDSFIQSQIAINALNKISKNHSEGYSRDKAQAALTNILINKYKLKIKDSFKTKSGLIGIITEINDGHIVADVYDTKCIYHDLNELEFNV